MTESPESNSQFPVRKSVQRLRWFANSFREQVAVTTAETGIGYSVDDAKLAAAFASWLRSFEVQKPDYEEERRPFVGFAAGLMLQSLFEAAPATALQSGSDAGANTPAEFWPEGYLYVSYCLRLRGLVLAQDFEEAPPSPPISCDLRTWWSFKENLMIDPSRAIAFLDLFAGEKPDWNMPDFFSVDGAGRLATVGRLDPQLLERG